jgi:hypothetical protein
MMMTMNSLPSAIADALLARSRQQGRTLHEVAIEALRRGLDVSEPEIPADPDSGWAESTAFEQALLEFAKLDSNPG